MVGLTGPRGPVRRPDVRLARAARRRGRGPALDLLVPVRLLGVIEAEQAEILAATRVSSRAEFTRSCRQAPAILPQSALLASEPGSDVKTETREVAQKVQAPRKSTSLNSGSRLPEDKWKLIVTPSPF